MNNRINVSVIIPAYNVENYICQCLDSVLNNNLSIEIICVDDGSTDSTLSVLHEYEEKDRRIRVITQKNAGAGAARNAGMQYASGEYLAFLDADDFFEPGMLHKAYKKAIHEKSDIVVFRSNMYIDGTGEYQSLDHSIRRDLIPVQEPFAGAEINKDIFKAFVGWPWDKLFRTEFVRCNKLQFQEQRTTNDALFVFMAIVKAERISTIDEVLAHYRRHDDGKSLSVSREKSWDCFYNALLAMRKQLKDWGLFHRYEQDFINYSLNFSLWNINTIKGKAYHLLYRSFKEEWYKELGLENKTKEYFYKEGEYENLQTILHLDDDEYLFDRIEKCLIHIEYQQKQLEELIIERNELTTRRKELELCLQKEHDLRNQEQNAIQKIKNSKSYRLGRIVTWPYRKIRDWINAFCSYFIAEK